jgi:hypothetical protein
MRGHPFREVLIFLVVAAAFWLPMKLMESTPQGVSSYALSTPSPDAEIGTFAEIRLSHPAEQVRLLRDGTLLFEMKDRREDMFDLTLPQTGVSIELQIVWPEDVEAPYAELRLEPDGRNERVLGFWGGPGEQRQRWFVELGTEE